MFNFAKNLIYIIYYILTNTIRCSSPSGAHNALPSQHLQAYVLT